MATFVDISPGPVANHFLAALRTCPHKKLAQLASQDMLKLYANYPSLTYRSIRFEGLEAYAKATKLPLCYFFFGMNTPPIPQYTPFDRFVIVQLNEMSSLELSVFKESLISFFPNPLFDLEEPAYRKRAYITMKHIVPDIYSGGDVTIPAYKKLDAQLLREQIEKCEKRNLAWIKLDSIIDFATYLGVSLHWLLNIKEYPLFCNSVLGDQIFSYYTLLPPQQRKQFLYLLWSYVNVDFVHEYMDCERWLQ